MFRSRALAKLQSPEKLDEPQLLIHRHNRLALAAVLAIPTAGSTWAVLGSVPEEGRGQGILMTPGSVKTVQAPAAGQIVEWLVTEGQTVEKGTVLALVEQIEIEQEMRESAGRLEDIEERNRVIGALRDRYVSSRRASIESRRELLATQIQKLSEYIERTRTLSTRTHSRNLQALAAQRRSLQESRQAAQKVAAALEKRLASYERLKSENLASDDQYRDVERDTEDARLKLQEADLRAQELQLQEVEINESHINAQTLLSTRESSLTNLELQLRELDNQLAQLEKSESEVSFRQENEARETMRAIDQTAKRLKISREVKTDHAGRILELTAREGQMLSHGQTVAQIDARSPTDELVSVAYFKPKEGKRLTPGALVRVTPSTVDRKKHGGILGEVVSVSDYPVTVEAVTAQVGNRGIAEQLTGGGFTIEVIARLERSPTTVSGYRWTSRAGPSISLTAGTGAEVWATVESRRPLSYVLPKLRGWSGL